MNLINCVDLFLLDFYINIENKKLKIIICIYISAVCFYGLIPLIVSSVFLSLLPLFLVLACKCDYDVSGCGFLYINFA